MDIQPGVMTLEESVSALQTSFTIAYLLAPTIAILFIITVISETYFEEKPSNNFCFLNFSTTSTLTSVYFLIEKKGII